MGGLSARVAGVFKPAFAKGISGKAGFFPSDPMLLEGEREFFIENLLV